MSAQRQGVKPVSQNRRSSLRSSGHPGLLYDFKEDSPKVPDIVKQRKKNSGKSKITRKIDSRKLPKDATKLTQNKGKRNVQVTPKVAERKKMTSTSENKEKFKQNKVKKKMKPLPPPNFDDVSPIVMNPTKRRSNRSSKEQTPLSCQNIENDKKLKNRSNPSLDTPRLSFSDAEKTLSDDSAIFVSPRQMRSRNSTEKKKTSTPAIAPCKTLKKEEKTKQPKPDKAVKDTSTPCDARQTRAFTRLKTVEPECSPVQRNETPTSDYGSMDAVDSLVIPSPVSEKKSKRKRGSSPTPAFSLEDDFGEGKKNYNPFPNKPLFLHVCSTSLLKNLWENKKWLVTSNFSLTHSISYPFRELSTIYIRFKIVVGKLFNPFHTITPFDAPEKQAF